MPAGRRQRRPWWLWLICGILICQAAGTAAWSQYRKQESGIGEAAIARLVTGTDFSITAGTLPKKPGDTTEVRFAVTNYEGNHVSETMLQYTAEPRTEGNLPLTFYLRRDGAADAKWIPEGLMTGNTASSPGILEPGRKSTHSYILTISWPLESGAGDYQYADEVDYVQIRIHARQVSPET